jgi:starch-binding outer membrane protein, SusD/RagB family
MKLNKNKILLAVGLSVTGVAIFSCSKSFLERPPVGSFTDEVLANKDGVNGLLIGAYAMLDGSGINDWLSNREMTSVWNAWAGSVAADDAHKGGGLGNQTERAQLENKTYTSTNDILKQRWQQTYASVQRANEALRLLARVTDGSITEAEATQITAEARFLRGVFHLEAAKMYNNIPFIDETITPLNPNYKVPNSTDPSNPTGWDKIEADFQFAIDNLPETQAQVGRPNVWAARAFLAKTYMQRAKLEDAKPLLDALIASGKTSGGAAYGLMDQYHQIFEPAFENGKESIFSVQMSVNEGLASEGKNGNEGDATNYPPMYGDGTVSWGHQPSFNLANAFKTTSAGLPMLDNFNDVLLKNNYREDQATFVPYTGELDPRIDWTMTRNGIPQLDWGVDKYPPDANGGPYWGKKWTNFKGDASNNDQKTTWRIYSGVNFPMVRFADVLLWAAEVEVEIGDINKAMQYVNQVRARAANPAGFVKKYLNDLTPRSGFSNTPAANYVISQYTSFPDKTYARKAVRFERRLELATEGSRFFDLQRFDRIDKKYGTEQTYMARIMNEYYNEERGFYTLKGTIYPILQDANFIAGKHEIYAIPLEQIDASRVTTGGPVTLTQNPGF